MQNIYIALLLAATLLTIYRVTVEYDGALFVCTAVVALNWVANTSYVLGTGETDATACFFVVDVLSLALVLCVSRRLAAGQMLASSYIGQIILHGEHFAAGGDDWRYWALLTTLGYGQLLLLAIWAAIPLRRDAGHELR